MADGTLKVGTITTSSGSGNITIGSGVTVNVNRPAFQAYLGSNQTVADATATKLNINTKVFDTDSCYDTSLYRFTPTEAGKYLVYGNAEWYSTGNTFNFGAVRVYKNGSLLFSLGHNGNASGGAQEGKEVTGVVDMNGSSDYLELFVYQDTSDSSNVTLNGGSTNNYLGAYKIGA
jgi:hypothetical protein